MKEVDTSGFDSSEPVDDAFESEQPITKKVSAPVTSMNCSYCGKPYAKERSNSVPFCSRRCQQLDLRNWLTESYGFPVESAEGEVTTDYSDEDESSPL